MLKKLYLKNFRNYDERRFDFCAPVVVLSGINGIGKTNILEAIHYIAIMRSFKNASPREMVRNGCEDFIIMAQTVDDDDECKLRIEQHRNGERNCFVNDIQEKRASALLHNFRSVIFAPEDRLIISGTAAVRRRFFDILISLENDAYLRDLQLYKHALAQRNAMLKKGIKRNIDALFAPFEELLAFHGERLMRERQFYAELLQNEVRRLAGNDDFRIKYRPDWKNCDVQFIKKSLADNRKHDILKGFTGEGGQLDDFDMYLGDFAMRNFASSGQTRLYSLYLKMAEFNLSCGKGEKPIALVDDVTGELDEVNKQKFFALLKKAEQVFFTFTCPQNIAENQQLIEL